MKKIAPIIITILMLAYLGGYAYVMFFLVDGSGIGRLIAGFIGGVLLLIGLAVVFTLKSRLKEINETDDEDLKKY